MSNQFSEVFSKLIRSDNIHAIAIKYVGVVLVFLLQVLIVRTFGAGNYGLFVQLVAWSNVMGTIAAFGQLTYLTKNIAVTRDLGDRRKQTSMIIVAVILMTVLLVLFTSVIELTKSFLLQNSNVFENSSSLIALTALMTLVSLQRILSGLNRGSGDAVYELFTINIVKPVVQVVAVLVIVFILANQTELNHNSLAITLIIAFIIVCALLFIKPMLVARSSKKENMGIADDNLKLFVVSDVWNQLFSQVRESVPFTLLNTVTAFEKNIDLIIVGFLLDPLQVGVYAFVTRLNRLSNIAQSTLNVVFGSKAAKAYAAADLELLSSQSRTITKYNFINAVMFFLLYVFFADLVLEGIDQELAVGLLPLLILSGAGVIRSLAGPVSVTANMTNNQLSALRITVTTLIVGAILVYLFTTYFGIIGAAIAVSIMTVSRAWLLRSMLSKKIIFD